jgi:hypothetical protein
MRKFDRSRRLLEAALFCRERVAAIALQKRDADATAEYLVEIVKYVRNSVTIVRLVVASEGQASTIFETLNDRGLELSALDLVKNYLFGRAET